MKLQKIDCKSVISLFLVKHNLGNDIHYLT